MAQYFPHPDGKKIAQLQKRIDRLCRLLREGVSAEKLDAAAAEVSAAFWRVVQARVRIVREEHVTVWRQSRRAILAVPPMWVIERCRASMAHGNPDLDAVWGWYASMPRSDSG